MPIPDLRKIAIVGHSSGGYATLVGLSFTPDVFACGVSISGMTNLMTFVASTPVYWKNWLEKWYRYVGDPSRVEDRRRMESQSPLFRAERITSPLLLIHGATDPRVKVDQAEQLVTALQPLGKPVDDVRLEGDGHRDFHWRNWLKIYRKTEDFLARRLGGRSGGFDWFELYQLSPR